jgi:hypothetical protein
MKPGKEARVRRKPHPQGLGPRGGHQSLRVRFSADPGRFLAWFIERGSDADLGLADFVI